MCISHTWLLIKTLTTCVFQICLVITLPDPFRVQPLGDREGEQGAAGGAAEGLDAVGRGDRQQVQDLFFSFSSC